MRVMLVTFISYAFNLNFGSLIGGLAFRYRLYACLGLSLEKTTEVTTLSILTNWLGYALVAGLLFVSLPFAVAKEWPFGAASVRIVGTAQITTAIRLFRQLLRNLQFADSESSRGNFM